MGKIKEEIERNRVARNEYLDDSGQITVKVEIPEKGIANRLINWIIWGNPEGSIYDKKHFESKTPSTSSRLERKEEKF